MSRLTATATQLVQELQLSAWVQVGHTARELPRRLSSGNTSIDALLDGGLPCGRISEILGALSCGKTSLLLALLAAATRRGEVTACVDVADALHPAAVAAAGADLQRLLWVRPPSAQDAVRCTELLLQAGGLGIVALDFGTSPPRRLREHIWPRLRHAAELSHTPLLILAPRGITGSFATLAVQLRQYRVLWQQPGTHSLFDGLRISAQLMRNTLGKEKAALVLSATMPGTDAPTPSPLAATKPSDTASARGPHNE